MFKKTALIINPCFIGESVSELRGGAMDKKEALNKIAEEIRKCKKCDLWKNRKNAVPGEGNPDAEIMFVGEAPGFNEDLQGRPFVGVAGKLLTSLIMDKLGLERRQVFITNVVKCRPPNNRDPKQEEIEVCSPYLDEQVRIIKPKIIVTLGRHSTIYFLKKLGINVSGVSQVRGKVFRGKLNDTKVIIIPTYHPAAALYNPRLRGILEKDFELIKTILEEIKRDEKLFEIKQIRLDEFFT